MPRSEISGSYVSSVSNLGGSLYTVIHRGWTRQHSTNSGCGSLLLQISSSTIYNLVFSNFWDQLTFIFKDSNWMTLCPTSSITCVFCFLFTLILFILLFCFFFIYKMSYDSIMFTWVIQNHLSKNDCVTYFQCLFLCQEKWHISRFYRLGYYHLGECNIIIPPI